MLDPCDFFSANYRNTKFHLLLHALWNKIDLQSPIFIAHKAREIMHLVASICASVCPSVSSNYFLGLMEDRLEIKRRS